MKGRLMAACGIEEEYTCWNMEVYGEFSLFIPATTYLGGSCGLDDYTSLQSYVLTQVITTFLLALPALLRCPSTCACVVMPCSHFFAQNNSGWGKAQLVFSMASYLYEVILIKSSGFPLTFFQYGSFWMWKRKVKPGIPSWKCYEPLSALQCPAKDCKGVHQPVEDLPHCSMFLPTFLPFTTYICCAVQQSTPWYFSNSTDALQHCMLPC